MKGVERDADLEDLRDRLDTATADWRHIVRFISQELKATEGEILLVAKTGESGWETKVVSLAGKNRGLRAVLAEMSRVERA